MLETERMLADKHSLRTPVSLAIRTSSNYQCSSYQIHVAQNRALVRVTINGYQRELPRHGHNARYLFNDVTPKLLQYSWQYPRIKFILSSFLLTRDYTWLKLLHVAYSFARKRGCNICQGCIQDTRTSNARVWPSDCL